MRQKSILNGRGVLVIPNEQELEFAKRLKMPNIYQSPVAVRNRVVFEKDLVSFASAGLQEREGYKAIIAAYPKYVFLYHFQFKEGITLSKAHLQTVDDAQDVNETPYFVVYQEHADNSLEDFSSRMDFVEGNFSHKILIPTLDPSTKDLVALKQKAIEIVKRGYKTVIILYRNPKRCIDGWQIIQANLQMEQIELISLGVQRRWINLENNKKISTLGAPLLFNCVGVSHYRPWSGGSSPQVLLDNDLFYVEPKLAGKGQIDYEGMDRRKKFDNCKKSQQYEFSRIDSLRQAQQVFFDMKPIKNAKELTVAGTKIKGIHELAEHFGML